MAKKQIKNLLSKSSKIIDAKYENLISIITKSLHDYKDKTMNKFKS